MGLTAWPEDDGTIDVSNGGEYVTLTREQVEDSSSFTGGEKEFLLSLFDEAVPGGRTCSIRR